MEATSEGPPPGGSAGGDGAVAGKVLRRSPTDRKIAGVAGGIAAHFGIDPLVVRVVFVLLALSGAIGIALYIAGWLLIPEEGSSRSVGDDLIDRLRKSPTWAPVLLIVIGALIALGNIPRSGGGLVWAALLTGAPSTWQTNPGLEGPEATESVQLLGAGRGTACLASPLRAT
ncbi:MAG: PspC domain-containing protein, partial [Nocardioidaceae bacterium]